MIISRRHKFIYIAIGKTGTTTIETALRKFNEVNVPKHTHISDLKRLTGIDHQAYFKFCFIRNPWDRLVSIYVQSQKPINLENADRRYLHEIANNHSFKEFIKILNTDRRELLISKSFESYVVDDETGQFKIDFLGRYENLQSDFDKACELLKIPKKNLPVQNPDPRQHYSWFYDNESKDIVASIFKLSIEMGHYKFENQTDY